MASQTTETHQQATYEANGHTPEDSMEYKLLKAYTQRKNPTHNHLPQSNGAAQPHVLSDRKKKKKRIKLHKFLPCIKPVREDDGCMTENHRPRPASDTPGPDQEVEDIVNKLSKITDSVHLLPSELETDGDDEIERIVQILREQGDRLNEEIENDSKLMEMLQKAMSYSYFKKLTSAFFRRLSPEELPPQSDPNEYRIALICELTHRLKIMDRHPMNRVLGFGATYLQEKYGSWVNTQGGYGKVFHDKDSEEEDVQ